MISSLETCRAGLGSVLIVLSIVRPFVGFTSSIGLKGSQIGAENAGRCQEGDDHSTDAPLDAAKAW